MAKTERELAFLRDLYINEDWTRRFTELADAHLDISSAENFLYINAGTGDHCLALRERAGEDTAFFASCENEDVLSIARDKAIAVGGDVEFAASNYETGAFDAVLADATLVPPAAVEGLINESVRVAEPGGRVMIMLPSAGSFGEIFSLLWEIFFNDEMGGGGAAAERLIAEVPSVSRIEEIAAKAGLKKLKTHLSNEVFEYDDGAALLASPLVTDFLMPEWLRSLTADERERVETRLAGLIDEEDGSLTFRFSVKATILMGEKS